VRWVRYGAILLVLTVLEVEMPALLRPFGAGPDLLLGFALALALHADDWRVFGPIWGIGLARDVMSLGPFGLHAILIGGGGITLWLARESLFRHHVLTLILTGGLFALALGLVSFVRLELAGGTPALGSALLRLLVAALLTGAATPLVVKTLLRTRLLAGFVPRREMEPAP
jgi:rod shape-determining protein MreD